MSTIQITNHLTLTKRPRRVALGFPGSGLGQPQQVVGFNRLIKILYVLSFHTKINLLKGYFGAI
jgi:hypothetical protein